MRIVAVSDIHGSLPDLPKGDVLVLAGDICPDFYKEDFRRGEFVFDDGSARQLAWLRGEFREWLDDLDFKHVVAIAGNHDFVFQKPYRIDLDWHFLQDSVIDIQGKRFFGTPWVPNLSGWAFYADNQTLEEQSVAMPVCDVLISHGPPYGYGDVVGAKYGSAEGKHAGNPFLEDAIKRIKPEIVLFGHMHENHGQIKSIDQSKLYNVAIKDDRYQVVYEPTVIDI